ncbi:MAG: Nif3-like dinuclear metal center hexameric protein [Treponema sp.]|jgi:dinuclear metal center YbgI/SA1388 family protein|nr:Nif3-like dinuclear metal center hexameric protein [Treponema sp.]
MTAAFTSPALDLYFRSILDLEEFHSVDSSMNGLQVDNDGAEIKKIAFAVDANLETFNRCAQADAGMLFVHHGLFWGEPLAVKGSHRERLGLLLDRNIALYAAHLPLDQNPRLGNNAALAELLGIEDPVPFGLYRGKKVGFKGKLKKPLGMEEAVKAISFMGRPPVGIFPFGKEKSETCAVISGGASGEALQALDEGVDLYVTGECAHSVYHQALEGKLNMIAGGHYSTEVWGVRRVMEECAARLSIDVEFIDVPTGL